MNNHFFHTILVVLGTTWSAAAQTDTVYNSVRQESGVLEAQRIETPLEQGFGTYAPARLMLKATIGDALEPDFTNNPGNFSYSLEGRPLVVGVEYKLLPSWSVGAYYGVNIRVFGREEGQPLLTTGLLQTDTRWYYRQKARIRAGKSANNFSDDYLTAEMSIRSRRFDTSPDENAPLDRYLWSVRWGAQRRWMKSAFFDYSIGVGRSINRNGSRWQDGAWTLDQRFLVGLAHFRPTKRPQALDACNVLHCFDEQKSMLKINIFNVVSGYLADNKFLSIDPMIAYERKIGSTPLSFEGTLGAKFTVGEFTDVLNQTWRQQSMTYHAAAEARWYYDQKRNILTGKGGNNLGGAFIALQTRYQGAVPGAFDLSITPQPDLATPTYFYTYNTIHLIWGIQRQILRHGYIQFKTGEGIARVVRYEYKEGQPVKKEKKGFDWSSLGELQIGFAF